jgi:hypothetical protein
MVFETLVFSPLNHLTRLMARENFIIHTVIGYNGYRYTGIAILFYAVISALEKESSVYI